MRKPTKSLLIAVPFWLAGCAVQDLRMVQSLSSLSPEEVKQHIAKYEASSPDAQTAGVMKYRLQGEPLWLVPSPCCDQFNYLYKANGKPFCAPSGGIAGHGDGSCPEGIEPFASSVPRGTSGNSGV